MARRLALAAATAAALLLPASALSAGSFLIKPNPVDFGGVPSGTGKSIRVVITNESSFVTKPELSISSGEAQFSLNHDLCSGQELKHGEKCTAFVTYHPSSASEETGTLRVHSALHAVTETAELKGHSVPNDTTPPNCTMIAKRHQKIIKQVKKNGKKVLKRKPFAVGLTSSEDGTVSARASGQDSLGQPISLETVDSDATAGNGVPLRMKLKKTSEKRILADVKKGLEPKMTLVGTCIDQSGNARTVGATIHFRDKKPGTPFGFPLIADPQLK